MERVWETGTAGMEIAMLTDAKIRSAKPADRAWRLADTGGLFVHITPAGKKIWRLRYKFEKREKLLTLGHYAAVSLAEARAEREEAGVFFVKAVTLRCRRRSCVLPCV